MRSTALLTVLTWLLFMPAGALAAEEENRSEQQAEAEAKGGDRKQKPSPIKRLVELHLDHYVVPARPFNIPLPGRTRTVQDVLDRLEEWRKDDDVGVVLLNINDISLPIAQIQEIRNAVLRLRKEGGKKVRAFCGLDTQPGYLLATAADEIAVAPVGGVSIPGLAAVLPYMKGFFQLRGWEFEVITAGKYKYPGFYNRRKPTDAALEAYTALLDGWFAELKKAIAEGRGISEEEAERLVHIGYFTADEALTHNLVDEIAYYDDYRERIIRREKVKRSAEDERDLSRVTSLQGLLSLIEEEMRRAQERYRAVGPKIAVLHARGPIIDIDLGPAMASMVISRDAFVKTIDEIRRNKTIKGVVLRIDSPGGSALASDCIWRALRELDEEKPLVVSQAGVAASGGYYLSVGGRMIFAQPTTITGSIGVIFMHLTARGSYNRSDIEMYPLTRGKRSLLFAPYDSWDKDEQEAIRGWIDDIYEVFLERVARSRKMPVSRVREIAQGRIYTGKDALEVGLVDRLGGLADAIEAVKELANIPPSAEVKIVHYPRPPSVAELIAGLGSIGGLSSAAPLMELAEPRTLDIFDELRLLTARPQPLMWIALPDLSAAWNPLSTFRAGLRAGPPHPAGILPDIP